MILQLSTATQLSTNLLFAWNQFSFLKEQMNRYIFQYKSMKSVKIKINKSINETSVSSISTDWSIQSISIKSDLPIFIDLSVYGNWTEWSAIWSEIIRVISKSNERAAGVRFEITSMISDQNCTTQSSITTLLHPFWDRRV